MYDGLGSPPVAASVGITGDRIAAIGPLEDARGVTEIDAAGPGGRAGLHQHAELGDESLIVDGRSQSDIRQGVTLEVFGEGWSMGPLNDGDEEGAAEPNRATSDTTSPGRRWASTSSTWQTKGVSPNVASFVGATTVRIHELGLRRPAAHGRRARAHAGARAAGDATKARSASARR